MSSRKSITEKSEAKLGAEVRTGYVCFNHIYKICVVVLVQLPCVLSASVYLSPAAQFAKVDKQPMVIRRF
jgi:hypothetical protein